MKWWSRRRQMCLELDKIEEDLQLTLKMQLASIPTALQVEDAFETLRKKYAQ